LDDSGKQAKVENKARVENKRNTPTETTTIKVERDWMPNHRCDVKVKVVEDNKVKVESRFQGATSNLADLPAGKEQLKLRKHQMAKRLFNSEVNLVSDWILEHRPKKHGAKFIHLSEYSIVEITNTTYYGVEMGMSKTQNVSMLFSIVMKRRYQQINKKMWEKDTLNQAE
jgi:hypothetical protein